MPKVRPWCWPAPGSGKTRVITHRIAHLMTEFRVPGWAILAVTFTNKAAGEMRERVRKLLDQAVSDGSLGGYGDFEAEGGRGIALPTVATFHSFCVRLLRREGAALAQIRPGFTTLFTIYDADEQLQIIKAAYKNLGLDDRFMRPQAALSRISHAKSQKQSPEEMAKDASDPNTERLAVVYDRYQSRLREANALDFDDLLLETVRLLIHDEATRERVQSRYEFLMVDEYQDTNRSQYELMRLVAGERRNIVVVGDEDQSIYGWRGANIRNILDFERDFPGAKIIRLEQNYRSTKNVLEAASAVVANNSERIGKWLWTESDAGEKITLYEAPDSENEALWIADTVESRLREDPSNQVAILYRTNSQSRQIEEALRRYGRKYVVVGGFSFYQRAEIRDTLAYLKLLVTPQDNLMLLRIINTPARGIGRTTIDQLEKFAADQQIPLWEAIGRALEQKVFGSRAHAALEVFRRKIEGLMKDVETRPVADTLRAVLEETGYRKMLEDEDTEEAKVRLANLDELLNAAADSAERQESLRDFLDHAALVSDSDNLDEKSQVSLLTMHNAKGLEFPVVFIAGLEEGLFPHSRSLDSESAMEEERRLCYVGMTRAEKKLYLSWARYRRRFGGGAPEASIQSRFVKEVPEELMEAMRGAGYGGGSSYGGGYARGGGNWRNAGRGYGQGAGQGIDLYAEQNQVRESAEKNLYTGKTYNSVEAIQRFFGNKPGEAPPKPAAGTSAGTHGAKPAASMKPQVVPPKAAAPGGKRKLGPGSSITHAKYGKGTILRLEGSGEDAKVTVNFPGHGLKKLVAKYAGIKVE